MVGRQVPTSQVEMDSPNNNPPRALEVLRDIRGRVCICRCKPAGYTYLPTGHLDASRAPCAAIYLSHFPHAPYLPWMPCHAMPCRACHMQAMRAITTSAGARIVPPLPVRSKEAHHLCGLMPVARLPTWELFFSQYGGCQHDAAPSLHALLHVPGLMPLQYVDPRRRLKPRVSGSSRLSGCLGIYINPLRTSHCYQVPLLPSLPVGNLASRPR